MTSRATAWQRKVERFRRPSGTAAENLAHPSRQPPLNAAFLSISLKMSADSTTDHSAPSMDKEVGGTRARGDWLLWKTTEEEEATMTCK